MSVSKIAKKLHSIMNESDARKVKPYDTKAEVLRVEGDIVWVKIPGGIDETPVQRTNNATPGDTVMVRVAGGRAWVAGNNTSPATDDTVANIAYDVGMGASVAADRAIDEASRAMIAADQAEVEASRAKKAADEVHDIAEHAEELADDANTAVNIAFNKVSFVEDIVGVLQLIAEHGQYAETEDTEPKSGKWYFNKQLDGSYTLVDNISSLYHITQDTAIDNEKKYYKRFGSGSSEDPYYFEYVPFPSLDEISTYYEKYYELIDINESIQNYVSSHLVLTNDGLSLMADNSNYRLDITPSGIKIMNSNGDQLASYGTDTIIGDPLDFHVKINDTELGFYQNSNKVAYIRNNQLFIEQSVVVKQMDVGLLNGVVNPSTGEIGLGQWTWKVHPNSENPKRNNLNLKWIG